MRECFFFSSRRRHTRFDCDWSSDVCSSDLILTAQRQHGVDHDGVPILQPEGRDNHAGGRILTGTHRSLGPSHGRSEEHTSELQSQSNLVCRLLLEKKNTLLIVFLSCSLYHF